MSHRSFFFDLFVKYSSVYVGLGFGLRLFVIVAADKPFYSVTDRSKGLCNVTYIRPYSLENKVCLKLKEAYERFKDKAKHPGNNHKSDEYYSRNGDVSRGDTQAVNRDACGKCGDKKL